MEQNGLIWWVFAGVARSAEAFCHQSERSAFDRLQMGGREMCAREGEDDLFDVSALGAASTGRGAMMRQARRAHEFGNGNVAGSHVHLVARDHARELL